MADEIKFTAQKEEMPEKEGPEIPVLDLSNAAVKTLIRSGAKRGFVTYDQINALLSSEEVKSEQIEDILAKLSEMGVNVVETKEAELEEAEKAAATSEEPEEETEGEKELVEVRQGPVPAKSTAKEPVERTDDPVRMYLREMGSVKLLSREGEIAIAKRIEAGREAMIAGLCESPLTFQAIIIWRDELNEGKVLLRDIIDLEASYAGPGAKAMPAPVNFWLAADLNNLALVEEADREFAQAREHLHQSVGIFERAGFVDSLSMAVALANLARVDTALNLKAEANSAAELAIGIFQKAGADNIHRDRAL